MKLWSYVPKSLQSLIAATMLLLPNIDLKANPTKPDPAKILEMHKAPLPTKAIGNEYLIEVPSDQKHELYFIDQKIFAAGAGKIKFKTVNGFSYLATVPLDTVLKETGYPETKQKLLLFSDGKFFKILFAPEFFEIDKEERDKVRGEVIAAQPLRFGAQMFLLIRHGAIEVLVPLMPDGSIDLQAAFRQKNGNEIANSIEVKAKEYPKINLIHGDLKFVGFIKSPNGYPHNYFVFLDGAVPKILVVEKTVQVLMDGKPVGAELIVPSQDGVLRIPLGDGRVLRYKMPK